MSIKRLIILTSFGLGSVSIGFSQQLPQYSQWSQHQFAHNAAHAGIKPCLEVHSLYRMQWVGFDGAPKSGFLTLSAPIPTKRKEYLSARQGIGLRFESDRIGQFNTNRVNLAYAAHFNFTRDTRLSLGLFGGMIQTGFDPSSANTLVPDPQVLRESSFIAPDASFGAWWNGENYYFGLMLNQLIPWKWDAPGIDSRYRFHSALNMGYRMKINDMLTFLPGAMVRIPPRGPLSVDIQAMADYNNKVIGGLGFRNTDGLLFFAGFKFNSRFSIHYSFDLTLSEIRKASSNTHEFSLVFNTCKPVNTSTSSCPLF